MFAGPLPGMYDPSGPGRLLFGFFAAMAETERENVRESTLEGLDAAARKGNHGGWFQAWVVAPSAGGGGFWPVLVILTAVTTGEIWLHPTSTPGPIEVIIGVDPSARLSRANYYRRRRCRRSTRTPPTKGKPMSQRTVLAPTTLLAAVVLALVAMVGAYAPRSHASGPVARIAPVAHTAQTAATLETTPQAAAALDFDIESLTCSANRTQGGPGQITCMAKWFGGTPNFDPTFKAEPGGSSPVTNFSNAARTATFTFGCIRSREYTVTLFVRDRNGESTSTQVRPYIPCGNF
ncbi:recombinase family protein [Streptomyces sp. NBC_01381]|nr:recombinase family protein [Streptomyces sp. NBC_01381]